MSLLDVYTGSERQVVTVEFSTSWVETLYTLLSLIATVRARIDKKKGIEPSGL